MPMNIKHKIVLFLMLFLSISVWAENASNVRARQEGNDIVITYDLDKPTYVYRLLMSVYDGPFKPLKEIDGDIGGIINPDEGLEIIWHPLEEYDSFIATNVRFKVETLSPYELYVLPGYLGGISSIKTCILGEFAYSFVPQMSYGILLGQTYKHGLGWYINARSNFNFHKSSLPNINEFGFIYFYNTTLPFYSGRTQSSTLVVNTGFMIDFLEAAHCVKHNRFDTFGFYIGGGYGWRRLFWETTDGRWAKYSPTSYEGFSGNLGLIGSVHGFTLKAGVNTINFRYMEIEAGVGWMF